MTWVILAFLSHLVFIPGLYDGFSLPKRVYVFGLGIAAIIYLFHQDRKLPLFFLILSYLSLCLVPLLWLSNLPLFTERLALDLASFAIFWAVALSDVNQEKIKAGLAISLAIVILVLAAEHFFPLTHGTMGNPKYTAFVAAQAAPLVLVLLPGVIPIFAAVLFLFFSESSRAALGAAIISLFIFGIAKQVKCMSLIFLVIILAAMASPAVVKGLKINLDRRALWLNSSSMIDSVPHLLFGIGRGQFEVEYPAYANLVETDVGQGRHRRDLGVVKADQIKIDSGAASFTYHHPHNEFLNSVIETGVLAAGLFWSILLCLAARIRLQDPITLALSCSLIVTILFSIFWFPFTHPSMAVTSWALAGLLWNHSSKSVSI